MLCQDGLMPFPRNKINKLHYLGHVVGKEYIKVDHRIIENHYKEV
jgi:hypothetical protein